MDKHFLKVRDYLLELNCNIVSEDKQESLFIVENEDEGIKNLILDCEDELLIMEQFLFEVKADDEDIYKSLLQKNREIVHGAFALDEAGKKVLYRQTLALENLDLNELEASFNALSFLMSEYADEMIAFAKK